MALSSGIRGTFRMLGSYLSWSEAYEQSSRQNVLCEEESERERFELSVRCRTQTFQVVRPIGLAPLLSGR